MAQIDTRHDEKQRLFELLVIEADPALIGEKIFQLRAKMEKEDIEWVEKEFKAWLAKRQ